MPILPPSSESTTHSKMPHQLFHGTTWHSRLLPSVHKFSYPYRYWGVNISALAAGMALPEIGISLASKKKFGLPLFSGKHRALQQFCADDYIVDVEKTHASQNNDTQDSAQALFQRLRQAFITQTGSAPLGNMLGLVVCRNVGLYFSPVNFYLGFDTESNPSHLLAEVSNTPWNKRHYYGFLLKGMSTEFCHDKNFHVSPFNPIDQQYCWQVRVTKSPNNSLKSDGLKIRIAINISDVRGEVLKTGVKVIGVPMTDSSIKQSLRRNPLMNVTSLTRIYWHALKLYAIKKVPYINYDEKLADSEQEADIK